MYCRTVTTDNVVAAFCRNNVAVAAFCGQQPCNTTHCSLRSCKAPASLDSIKQWTAVTTHNCINECQSYKSMQAEVCMHECKVVTRRAEARLHLVLGREMREWEARGYPGAKGQAFQLLWSGLCEGPSTCEDPAARSPL